MYTNYTNLNDQIGINIILRNEMTEQVKATPDENKLIAERRGKLEQIRENCPANGHPNTFERTHYADKICKRSMVKKIKKH